ncbi:MAG: hypothetical protein M5R40_16020 [Anaerolineae bacterium]|nr:hypothetical protein [Anaerolineae bacterium]
MSDLNPEAGKPSEMDEAEPRLYTDDFERRFFDGAEQVAVEITLMRDDWETLLAFMREQGWKQVEGLVTLLMTGMAFLRNERALSMGNDGAAGMSDSEVRRLLDRLATIEAEYAVMKSFAFNIMRDHQALELKYVPIERQYVAYRQLVSPLRKENDALKAEVERLRRELKARESAASRAPRTYWQRLLDVVRGR